MYYFVQGLTLGLAYVAPIGVQNLFVINSAMAQSRRRALLTALIVVFFDVTLALFCFFGVGALIQRYEWLQMCVLGIGGLIVIKIGAGLLREKPRELGSPGEGMPLMRTAASACVVTWFNPQALIDGTMMLGAFYVTLPPEQSAAFIGGVACASALWFTGLSLVVSLFRDRLGARLLRAVNIVCGVVIIFYGAKLLYGLTRFF
ncbi:LysE family transporter [Cloacibacillus sp. An23]|uniref:LysE/ArgO family amino acid transporter n=1 Tax=Cloacibacillus sp. An23 TaxID=1965591 RepID=UPI000B367F93|nr:LysE family transporter [Cloacibacillus sp. An23]OUO92950.1 L-lysine permease [Cloacibacillus sp. An23]